MVSKYREYTKAKEEQQELTHMLEEESDPEMREMLRQEIEEYKEKIENLHQELLAYLIPKNPDDDKNIILEIRAGAGGEEAALFGACLLYTSNSAPHAHLSLALYDIDAFISILCHLQGEI